MIFTAIFVVVGVIGFIGNLLTVVVIRRTPSLRTQTNYFLASLAVSDLLLILVGVPFDLFYLWRKHKVPAFSGYCELTSKSTKNVPGAVRCCGPYLTPYYTGTVRNIVRGGQYGTACSNTA